MFSEKDYEDMIQTLYTGGEVQISGFMEAINFIFAHAIEGLPVLSESNYKAAYERDFWGQTWMAAPLEGSSNEVQALFTKIVNPNIERGKFSIRFVSSESPRAIIEKGIKFEEAIEHILILLDIPNGLDKIARIYKTESGIRAVPNKTRIRSN